MNPYYIDEPCVISFSGGRTSAYMTHKIIQAHYGLLPKTHKIIFCNTGMEADATLDFVHNCEDAWEHEIVWLEYDKKKTFKKVNYGSAARNGEPFAQLIDDKKYLPNMVQRFCTVELKILTIDRYMKSIGEDDYLTVVGIRADEPRRVAKMNAKEKYYCPLHVDKRILQNIMEFWSKSPWDLGIPKELSNCTLCFLKGHSIKMSLIRDGVNPDWWIDQEKKIGGLFRSDQPSYQAMKDYAGDQFNMFDDESIPCFCGD